MKVYTSQLMYRSIVFHINKSAFSKRMTQYKYITKWKWTPSRNISLSTLLLLEDLRHCLELRRTMEGHATTVGRKTFTNEKFFSQTNALDPMDKYTWCFGRIHLINNRRLCSNCSMNDLYKWKVFFFREVHLVLGNKYAWYLSTNTIDTCKPTQNKKRTSDLWWNRCDCSLLVFNHFVNFPWYSK